MAKFLSALDKSNSIKTLIGGKQLSKENEEMTGTTIMALTYNGGVLIAADSRTSAGSFVANRVSDKLTHISDRIYCCRSGSSADTQAIADLVRYHMDFHRMSLGNQPLVKSAAIVFKNFCYNYRDQMSASIIVAGWDKINGPQIYTIPVGGMCLKQKFAIGGSGSTFIYGYMDTHYKDNMTKEQCIDLAKKAISLSIYRDSSSGGIIRMADITENSIDRYIFKQNEFKFTPDYTKEAMC
ncbi:hypothetical protein A3Q56_03858 [Intoshia linei]|uniref:Proteasome subunit beta n=1 Tax=Intoshia linei TaxID=1819745 RepID=A0A177B292_9BILA|nr:hypothetical protein A3Q56_03858 [Intoshia linei]